jgi:hypothetical protein
MNCYVGLAKRIAKSCFPELKPVPQLEPLDAKNIIKQEVKDISTNKACFALSDAHERLFKPISFKPISDEEAWEATLAWAEAKAQEREALATKEEYQTDTDESHDSYDSNDLFGPPMVGAETTYVYNLNDAAAAAAMWRDDAQTEAYESIAAAKAVKKFWANVDAANAAKSQAATIIQATERGRVVRMVVLIVADATEVLQLSKFVAEDWTGIAVARAVVAMGVMGLMKTRAVGLVNAVVEWRAATIIQATARGRAVRIAAWDAAFDKVVAERAKRRHTAKETRRAWKAAFDPTTWYRL